jgi:oligopeptide/dipeptide ABC transporter ATP-binding protein
LEPILELTDVVKYFNVPAGGLLRRRYRICKAVDGVSLTVNMGATLGIAGESGSGKTTLARLILFIEDITSGSITYKGKDAQKLSWEGLMWRRREIQTVFQDAGGSLSPRMRVRDIVREPLEVHYRKRLTSSEINAKTEKTLRDVGLGKNILNKFPHELSGGQKQRVAIARAIILEPSLIILDEPVSSLDVSVRGQILNLLIDLQEEHNLTYIIISHDLLVLQKFATDIAIMYLGKIIEFGDARDIFQNPTHPYTKALIDAIPQPMPGKKRTAAALYGEIPSQIDPPAGCGFHPRCAMSCDLWGCMEKRPELFRVHGRHYVACNMVMDNIEIDTYPICLEKA